MSIQVIYNGYMGISIRKTDRHGIKMRKKDEIDDTEKDLFQSAMRGIKRMTHTKITNQYTPSEKKPLKKQKPSNPLNLIDEEESIDMVSGDDLLEFNRTGLQHKVLRKLRQGKYTVEATLDLHGKRVHEARETLNDFLLYCLKKNIRHALIIHGKGHGTTKPILKNKLNQWLRQLDFVLAFCSATRQEGRSGAVYLLLKGRIEFDE
jgi:DNA-nicking Smr family endonuclease